MLDTFSTIDQTLNFDLKHRSWLTQQQLNKLQQIHCDVFLVLRNAQYYIVLDWSRRGNTRIATDAYLITVKGMVPVWDAEVLMRVSTLAEYASNAGSIPQYWTPLTKVFMPRVHQRVLQLVRDSGRGPVSLLCHYVPQSDPQPLDVNMYVTPVKRMGPKPGKRRVRRTRLPDIL